MVGHLEASPRKTHSTPRRSSSSTFYPIMAYFANVDDKLSQSFVPQGCTRRMFTRKSKNQAFASNSRISQIKNARQHKLKKNKAEALILKLTASYMTLDSPKSLVAISIADQYCIGDLTELGLFATRTIPQGTIRNLSGIRVGLTKEEVAYFDKPGRNFSIGISTRTGLHYLVIGPPRFANHECIRSNAELVPAGRHGVLVRAKRTIPRGHEITVDYGPTYFEEACRCKYCMKQDRETVVSGKRYNLRSGRTSNLDVLHQRYGRN
jgi:SET domain